MFYVSYDPTCSQLIASQILPCPQFIGGLMDWECGSLYFF